MNRAARGLFTAAFLAAAACAQPPPETNPPNRLTLLARAFELRYKKPDQAVTDFAAAGPGTSLESARLEGWYDTLRRIDADSDRWRAFLDARPPMRLAGPATLALAAALVNEDDREGAAAVLVDAPDIVRHDADLELLELGDPSAARLAARRLVLDAPHRLRGRSPALEREILSGLTHADWMRRAAAWRRAGLGSRGAAELRSLRRAGAEERQRRIELARCELDAGSTSRALSALPSGDRADAQELTLRAEAYRRRGWGRVPDASAVRSFRSCLELASQALTRAPEPAPDEALALVVECGTESGQLDSAIEAWWRLESIGWRSDRRTWLGRRLGVAMARSGIHPDEIEALESCVPDHDRCLRYWRAEAVADREVLAELTDVEVGDLYSRWARQRTGTDRPMRRLDLVSEIGAAVPPPSVAWLDAHADHVAASDEWQRVLAARHPSRAEALAASELATRAGRPVTAIRTLTTAFPELSSVDIVDAPSDAVRAYLPLRWSEHLRSAARETGLDPWLIAALARQESVFAANARSPAGARGVLQLMPGTAVMHSRALGLGSRPDLGDPATNIRLGAHELADLMSRFGAIEPSLAAYNAGAQRVRRWWRQWPDPRVFTESIPIPETYTYVRRVVFLSEAYRRVHADTWRDAP